MGVQHDVENYLSFEAYIQFTTLPPTIEGFLRRKDVDRFKSGCFPHIIVETMEMKKKGNLNGESKSTSGALVWVSITLDEACEAEILKWEPNDATLFAALLEMVNRGHSVGVKPAPNGEGYMAFATSNSEHCPNEGLGLSAFAGEPRDAVIALVYKHVAISDGVWSRNGKLALRRFR